MASWRRWLGFVAIALVCGGWAPAQTDSGPGLRWQAPVGCPAADAMQSQLDALMGDSERLDATAIDGQVALSDAGYVLDLTIGIDDQVETRRVESTDCVLLTRTAALLVAVTIDAVAAADAIADDEPDDAAPSTPAPDPRQETLGPARVAVQPPEPIQSVQSPTEPADAAAPPPERDWQHGIGAGVAGGVGIAMVPGVTGGLEAHVGWRFGPVRLRALGYHWFSRRESLATNAGVTAALSGGGVRGCYALSRGRLDVPLCAGPDIAAFYGTGFGSAVRERSNADVWIALAAGAGVEVRLGRRFALLGRAELVVALRRPALHLDSADGPLEVFRAPVTGFRLTLGASVFSR